MNYRLTPIDYRDLWLVLTPEEVKDEFGEYSHSARHIRSFYKRAGLSKMLKHRKELMRALDVPEGVSKEDLLYQEIERVREITVRKIWNKIREFKQEWDFT